MQFVLKAVIMQLVSKAVIMQLILKAVIMQLVLKAVIMQLELNAKCEGGAGHMGRALNIQHRSGTSEWVTSLISLSKPPIGVSNSPNGVVLWDVQADYNASEGII
ncbi:hypothetical protein BELL_1380g00010 [Botrytis elliptica]|uniref:Uncharacterized protein n=1 Tax=Botrytis elliptica TaxID=278938 RepID=A0A4Z1I7T9_9HELO|nr:hypothetical protein BELL_1380g00010 [Botrytis elliptica]